MTINLNCTYIDAKDDKLYQAYMDECERQGVKWADGQKPYDKKRNVDILQIGIGEGSKLYYSCGSFFSSKHNYKQLTLEDLKPSPTREVYTPVHQSEAIQGVYEGKEFYYINACGEYQLCTMESTLEQMSRAFKKKKLWI